MKELYNLKIAYWPNNYIKNVPGDRRRFLFYVKTKNIKYENFSPKSNYDIVFLSEASDFGIVKLLKKNNTKVIYQCINSYYLPNSTWKDYFRGLTKFITRKNKRLYLNYRKKLINTLSEVDAVVCASEEQANDLLKFNTNVHCIPDMTYGESIKVKDNYSSNDIINLVWEGLPSNTYQLNKLKKILLKFSSNYNFVLNVITDRRYYKHMNMYGKILTEKEINDLCDNIRFIEWNPETYSKYIINSDIAVIPIDNNNNVALGKPENKLIFFWKMGIPTITDSTISYDRVMKDAGINLSCQTNEDWLKKLLELASSENLRKSIGLKGRRYAQKNYSEAAVLEKWDNIFKSIL